MDLINQAKGDVLKIWNTNDESILRKIYQECIKYNENFYDPNDSFRRRILLSIKEDTIKL